MIPTPPPVGYTITLGSLQPSCSAISKPMVFFPSSRYGSFSVDTSWYRARARTAAVTSLAASPITPSTR